ncbi:MAG TPA: SulP family inorganic anion transporter [Aliidongia sp.]|nr:SulP family inorganic anion transporter [Aliidongia sp.]
MLPQDLVAGLTLAAIAIPEQMATARLGGFSPEIGFWAFAAGSLAFAMLGANRFLSAGADSTITPIFASGLALLAAAGTPHYAVLAATLALLVGGMLVVGGLLRLGWIADLLSVPVTTGFLAGISIHIIVSQLPGLLGVPPPDGSLIHRVGILADELPQTNLPSAAIGLSVLALTLGSDRISTRVPGALIGLFAATISVAWFGLEPLGVAVVGTVSGALPAIALPATGFDELPQLVPLALIVALVTMVQTAATTRSFVSDGDRPPSVDRDFIGIGAGSILAGLIGAFPVNASPPRTAIVEETGGRSQVSGLVAAAVVLSLLTFGAGLLARVPQAALAGILLFIALRIFRVPVIAQIYRRTFGEFCLVVITMIAIIVLPTETGVALGIVLSLLHGMWSNTRARAIEFERVPGTSIWWAPSSGSKGETLPGVVVIAFQAPLSFLNAYEFRRGVLEAIDRHEPPPHLVVLESSSIIAIDYTAAQILAQIVEHCRARGISFAVARLESVRAFEAMSRFGILDLLGPGHMFHSVEEAVTALGGHSR